MEYFQDGIEWVGDHTNFTSKVIEIPRPPLTYCTYFHIKGVCKAANSSHCYKCYVYDKDFYESFEIILNYIVMLTSATGLVGNFLSIYVLTKTGLCSRFSNLLIMLAYADIRFISSCRKPYSSTCFLVISVWRRWPVSSNVLTFIMMTKTWWTFTTRCILTSSIQCIRSFSSLQCL